MALTSRAPFNRNQFRAFTSFSGQSIAKVGGAAITETGDTAAGVGTAVVGSIKSSLLAGRGGPTSLQNRFRSFRPNSTDQTLAFGASAITESSDTVAGVGGDAVAGSAALTESPDTAVGVGSGATGAAVVSSLKFLRGPQNRFRQSRVFQPGTPPTPGQGVAAITETADVASGAGNGFTLLLMSSALNPGNLGPGASPFNNGQFTSFPFSTSYVGPLGNGVAALTESADVAAGVGGDAVTGTAAIAETSDTAAGVGGDTVVGAASITESSDAAVGAGVAGSAAAGSASITESADVAAGVGGDAVAGVAAIAESADTAAGVGNATPVGSGSAALTESSDTAAGTGTASNAGVGSGAITESSDLVAGVGALGSVGIAAATESSDPVVGIGGLNTSGFAAVYEGSDIAIGVGGHPTFTTDPRYRVAIPTRSFTIKTSSS